MRTANRGPNGVSGFSKTIVGEDTSGSVSSEFDTAQWGKGGIAPRGVLKFAGTATASSRLRLGAFAAVTPPDFHSRGFAVYFQTRQGTAVTPKEIHAPSCEVLGLLMPMGASAFHRAFLDANIKLSSSNPMRLTGVWCDPALTVFHFKATRVLCFSLSSLLLQMEARPWRSISTDSMRSRRRK